MGSYAGDLLRFYKSILDLYDFAAVFMIFMCDSLNSAELKYGIEFCHYLSKV